MVMLDLIHTDLAGTPLWAWGLFAALVLGLLTLDLFIVNRTPHTIGKREALLWTAIWVSLAAAFGVAVYFWKSPNKALEFATAYLVEYSLSIDNIFLFILIFSYFKIQRQFRHRVLFWGVLGALIMRAIFIGAGVALIQSMHWMLYVFGGFLIVMGIKQIVMSDHDEDPSKSLIAVYARKYLPITEKTECESFFKRIDGKFYFTALFLVLLVVEFTDVIFAVDSIPACMSVTQDPFILYTSNIFAIMGLRSLYFLLSGFLRGLRFLKPALAFILLLIGVKLILKEANIYDFPTALSLGLIAYALTIAITLSLKYPLKDKPKVEAVDKKKEKPSS